jgi:hypothetical protein
VFVGNFDASSSSAAACVKGTGSGAPSVGAYLAQVTEGVLSQHGDIDKQLHRAMQVH